MNINESNKWFMWEEKIMWNIKNNNMCKVHMWKCDSHVKSLKRTCLYFSCESCWSLGDFSVTRWGASLRINPSQKNPPKQQAIMSELSAGREGSCTHGQHTHSSGLLRSWDSSSLNLNPIHHHALSINSIFYFFLNLAVLWMLGLGIFIYTALAPLPVIYS